MVQFLGLDPSLPIALDAVGTLIVPAEPVAQTYRQHAAGFGVALSTEEIQVRFRQLYSEIWGAAGESETSEVIERDRWRQLIDGIFGDATPRSQQLFESLWEHYATAGAWKLAPGAASLIKALKHDGRVWGIASNFDQRLHQVLATFSELSSVPFAMTSAEIGRSKPSSDFFQAVAHRMDHAQPLMLGDSFKHDVVGAIRAGWWSAWITTTDDEPNWADLPRDRLVVRGSLVDFSRQFVLG